MHDPCLNYAPIPSDTLNVDACLASGQAFRWRRSASGVWRGVIGDSGVIIHPGEQGFLWQTYPVPDQWELLQRYFALEIRLNELYASWRLAEPRVEQTLDRFAGLRILRQEPEEVFFAFLCASCNTVVKIQRTICALAARYGRPIAIVDGETFYRFPAAERLADAAECDLRDDLWGYRAPRLIALARYAASQGKDWLGALSHAGYDATHSELASLRGIGPKIADCICLFGLGYDQAVPIDVHVRRIAGALFQTELPQRSLTPLVYARLGDLYRKRFGPFAGWAQQYLFYADLRKNRAPVSRAERHV